MRPLKLFVVFVFVFSIPLLPTVSLATVSGQFLTIGITPATLSSTACPIAGYTDCFSFNTNEQTYGRFTTQNFGALNGGRLLFSDGPRTDLVNLTGFSVEGITFTEGELFIQYGGTLGGHR